MPERIRLIREAIGYEIPLRIDANQGWDVKTAIATLKELERYNIQHCEEPIPRWDFMRLRKVKRKARYRSWPMKVVVITMMQKD